MTHTSTTTAPTELAVRDPARGRLAGTVAVDSADDVARKAAVLRVAQPAWASLSYAHRARWLHRWRDWMLDNEARLTELVQRESGKSLNDAAAEIPIALEVINYYARHAEAFLAREHPRPHAPTMVLKRLTVAYHPQQLVGLITPWNGPIGNPMLDLPAALMAGCAVLTKPSEETPLAWAECVRGWREDIGAPLVLDAALGRGETGAAVVEVVDMVHFTGSARTGRRIGARCAERLIPCSLELGGKDPMIVCADADLERAANAAIWGGFANAGQFCISVERIYVEQPVYDEFVRLVVAKASRLRVGTESAPRVEYDTGAIATEDQLNIISAHVDEAVAAGARVLTGGHRRSGEGLYYEPTVLVDVDHTMRCMREETFGPTLPIMNVRDTAEAIRLANDSPYGLSASVWTRDGSKADRIATELDAGAVNINNVLINLFQLGVPQGGWGDSGIGGRLGGAAGIRKYCREKVIVSERLTPNSEVYWYPASTTRLAIQQRVTRLLGAGDWRRRLGISPSRRGNA